MLRVTIESFEEKLDDRGYVSEINKRTLFAFMTEYDISQEVIETTVNAPPRKA